MHDVGKIGIPDRVLLKPGKLDAEEWAMMQSHTHDRRRDPRGLELAAAAAWPRRSRSPTTSAGTARGYPAGLRGEEIPLAARICAVCDVFDALLSSRPYKARWTLEEALAELDGAARAASSTPRSSTPSSRWCRRSSRR